MTIITWFSIKLSMNGRKKNETTWAAKGLICFKPTRLSHRPLCQWWSVWPLTSGTRRSCGPRVSGSALRENIKGVHTIWASDWQSINHSSPATVQLQCAGVFFSSSCVPVSPSCAKTHTARSWAHKSRCTGFHLTPTVSLGSSQHSAPSSAPPLISISFIKHMRTCFFFFCRSGWPSVTEQHIFYGVGWGGLAQQDPCVAGAGVGLGVHKVWKQSNLVQTRKWARCFCHLLGRRSSRKLYCCTVPTVLDCRKPLVTSGTIVKAGLVDGTCFTLNWILF